MFLTSFSYSNESVECFAAWCRPFFISKDKLFCGRYSTGATNNLVMVSLKTFGLKWRNKTVSNLSSVQSADFLWGILCAFLQNHFPSPFLVETTFLESLASGK